jgi:hypothetical protein
VLLQFLNEKLLRSDALRWPTFHILIMALQIKQQSAGKC